jgi:hypothetical protein
MKRINDVRQIGSSDHIRLFDQDGLPWTSRMQWGVLLFWVGGIFIIFAPLVGIYLGLWLISKGKSSLSLILYLTLAAVFVLALFGPSPEHGSTAETVIGAIELVSLLILWLVGAFALRRDVIRYYSGREGNPFPLNPVLTAFFGPWYVGGRLRADYPLDDSGNIGTGVLKLIV